MDRARVRWASRRKRGTIRLASLFRNVVDMCPSVCRGSMSWAGRRNWHGGDGHLRPGYQAQCASQWQGHGTPIVRAIASSPIVRAQQRHAACVRAWLQNVLLTISPAAHGGQAIMLPRTMQSAP